MSSPQLLSAVLLVNLNRFREINATFGHHVGSELIREAARWQAKRDIGGVFKLILKLASPELVARALPRASMQYFEFGAARGELLGRGRLRAVQTGVPLPLVPWN